MDRVTDDRNALHDPMEDEKITRLGMWRKGLVAKSHVVTKNPGQIVNVSWQVTNTGGATGQAGLDIESGGSLVFIGPAVDVPPGATVTLRGTWTIPAGSSGTITASTFVVDAGAGRTIATHPFTVNIPPPVGAILTASPAGPSIT
jgi:hypothetical protein